MRLFLENERGIALVLTLWVLTLLSVIVGEFCYVMRTEVNITRNFKEEAQAYYVAVAGLNRAIAELVKNEVAHEGSKPPDTEEEIRWRINTEIPPLPFGPGEYEVRIENEGGKVNINRAGPELLRMMLNAFDLTDYEKDVIVDSMLDWRDSDKFHRLNGAEDDYYRSLPRPYKCKDGDFDSVEELLLVRGVTDKIFYGGVREMVTIYQDKESSSKRRTRRRTKRVDFNRINVNAASLQMLCSLPQMTEDLAQEIVEYRKEDDLRSMTEIASIVGPEVYAAINPYITFHPSPWFTIQSWGRVKGSQTRQGVQTLVKVDTSLRKVYRMIEWLDGPERPGLVTVRRGESDLTTELQNFKHATSQSQVTR